MTITYRAPEVIFTKGNYDYKIDIWSLGYILIENKYDRCIAVELL